MLLPLTAAIAGVTGGPRFLGHPPVVPTDLDSHFRYVSGLFLGMLLLMTCLIYFLIEVRMSLGAIHVREELLELDSR